MVDGGTDRECVGSGVDDISTSRGLRPEGIAASTKNVRVYQKNIKEEHQRTIGRFQQERPALLLRAPVQLHIR